MNRSVILFQLEFVFRRKELRFRLRSWRVNAEGRAPIRGPIIWRREPSACMRWPKAYPRHRLTADATSRHKIESPRGSFDCFRANA
jgi:hypothetical protein